MTSLFSFLLFVTCFVSVVFCDIYMQAARGSNNRLDERGRDRANANRLFNSQNNNRGGYNVGHLTYYQGEHVPISWSNQHSAGKYQLKENELVIQFACGEKMRDGTTTNTIPDRPTQCANWDCDTDVEYGRHESWTWYQYCKATSRNKGLFIANQNLNNKHSARYTRQQPGGTRYAYECPEERDYYPYWRATPWRDIAIYTNTVERCTAYLEESQNVKNKNACMYKDWYWDDVLDGYVTSSHEGEIPITEALCDSCSDGEDTYTNPNTGADECIYYWVEFESWGMAEPQCLQTSTTRANHHGLKGGRAYWTHTWEVPEETYEGMDSCCVIRMRYNITTDDYEAWESTESIGAGLDYNNNSQVSSPDADDDPAWVAIWERFGLTYADVEASFNGDADSEAQKSSRGYVFRNNPRVDPFGHLITYNGGQSRILLQLAINTNQFGRTFQDRTHCFHILERPDYMDDDAIIHLLTVQGKRGNIVQVYPGTEYYFVPEPLTVPRGEYVHICWTGSNRNPHNNAGQGLEGTDRSNICPLTQQQWSKENYGNVDSALSDRVAGAVGDLGNSYPDFVQEPAYELPAYYNYQNKRDIPRQSSEMSTDADGYDLDAYPYNDPYNSFWFGDRGAASPMGGLDIAILGALCTGRRTDIAFGDDLGLFDFGNMEELDDAGTTVCIQPIMPSEMGEWNFVCTRNNNFSNRSQKGTLVVGAAGIFSMSVTSLGLRAGGGTLRAVVIVLPGAVESGESLEIVVTTWLNDGGESTIVEITGSDGGEFASASLVDGAWAEVWIPYVARSLSQPKAWRREDSSDEWEEHSDASIEHEYSTTYGVVNISEGGYYTISNEPDVAAYIAIIVGVLLFATVMALMLKKKCSGLRKRFSSTAAAAT